MNTPGGCVPFRGTSAGWRNGQTDADLKVSKGVLVLVGIELIFFVVASMGCVLDLFWKRW